MEGGLGAAGIIRVALPGDFARHGLNDLNQRLDHGLPHLLNLGAGNKFSLAREPLGFGLPATGEESLAFLSGFKQNRESSHFASGRGLIDEFAE
jgi:hypothetical protein